MKLNLATTQMKNFLIFLGFFISCISFAQSKWPPCNGNYLGPCFESYTFPNGNKNAGDKYVGEIRNSKWDGQGTYTASDGSQYVGQYKDGKQNGQGTFTFPDGKKYVGQFKDDQYYGQGTYSFPNGAKYVGQFKDSKYEGQGIFYNANGSIQQQGVWRSDEFIHDQSPPAIATVITKPLSNNPQDIKRQKCISLGLVPGSIDFQQCIN